MQRDAGLLMAGFLIAASLTGSLPAWQDELEGALLPGVFRVARPRRARCR